MLAFKNMEDGKEGASKRTLPYDSHSLKMIRHTNYIVISTCRIDKLLNVTKWHLFVALNIIVQVRGNKS